MPRRRRHRLCPSWLISKSSRYMLMTGRYSMKEHKDRRIMKDREPTLGKLFKDNGYTTGIFGKAQPLQTQTKDFQSDVFPSIQFVNRTYRLKKIVF